MDEMQNVYPPIQVFYSYASEDEGYRQQLEKHLSLLRRQGVISDWHKHKIMPGDESSQTIATHLDTSSIILLLISPDFMASDYCYQVEMLYALQRQASGLAYVIPIILRPVDWQSAPFSALSCLPRDRRPVTQWHDRDEAFYDIALGIREAIDAINRASATSLPSLFFKPESTTRIDQNRQRFIKRVRATWITGVLDHLLHNAALLAPGLHEQPAAVLNPWQMVMQETDQPARPLPPEIHISQIFDDANGELLILGEPGAGKTTLLLQLARDLLARAERDISHPLPAILNLSSWSEKRPPFTSWLIDELHDKYSVPRKLAASWLASDQMILLLDGLDEVGQPHRAACITTLNEYHEQHHLTSMVICSRSTEYMSQATRLALQKAISIQPLTFQQIDTYLSDAGPQLSALRATLHQDAELREMAKTPLMLNILMLTYQDKIPDTLADPGSSKQRQDRVFDHYVRRMLERRSHEKRYPQRQTKLWLASLARQMKLHGQTEFYIERLQRDWLVDHGLRLLYRIISIIICFLIASLTSFLIIGLSIGSTAGLVSALGIGLAIGVMPELEPQIYPTEAFIWSWKVLRHHWFLLIILIFTGALLGIVDVNTKYMFFSAMAGIVSGGLLGTLFVVLVGGLSESMPDIQHTIDTNHGIKQSLRHCVFVILVFIPLELLFILLGNRVAIIGFTGLGLLGLFGFGGLACIQHVILRFLLWRTGVLPWRLPQFLDYAAERILLRKVGGGYIFIHRLLLDYFTGLDAGDKV